MNRLRQIPFYTFLLALFFCLHGAADNFGFITAGEILRPGLQVLAGIIILFIAVFLFSKNRLYAGFISFFIAAWYLFFGALKDSLRHAGFAGHYTVLLPLLLLATLIVIFFFKRKNAELEKITLFFNVLLFAYCIYDTAGILVKHAEKPGQSFAPGVDIDPKTVTAKPDVYFLLFDEYAGYKSLQDSFGFKNDSLYSELRGEGFDFLPVFANYHYTAFSMSSILNMDYILPLKIPNEVAWKDVQQRCNEIKDAAVFKNFQELGYNVSGYSIFDVTDHKSLGGNSFLKGHSYILTEKIFHNRIIKDLGWELPGTVQDLSFMHEFAPADLNTYNDRVEDSLMNKLHRREPQPEFVYAHFLLPHYPFLFDSTGRPVPADAVIKREDAYLSYLKYCNKKMSGMVKAVISSDEKAIIIVMSDHGYRDATFTQGAKPAYFDNICAVRNPAIVPVQDLRHPFSNVNFFRYFFNQDFNQHFPYLPDSMISLHEKE